MWTICFTATGELPGGGFLSLLLAVLMIAVVAEMWSRWQSRAAAAACPDLFSRQLKAVRKAARILFPLAFVRDIQLDLSSLASPTCWKLLAVLPPFQGQGVFFLRRWGAGLVVVVRGRGSGAGGHLSRCGGYFFSFSSFIIQNKATNNKRIHFQVFLIAEKVPCRFVRCRQFLLPSFFAALNGTKQTQKWAPAGFVLINRMGSRRVNTESHWSTLVVVCSFARGRWEFPGTQEICSNNRTT